MLQDPTKWSRVAKKIVGVSEETTTGVKRLYEMTANVGAAGGGGWGLQGWGAGGEGLVYVLLGCTPRTCQHWLAGRLALLAGAHACTA